MGFMIAADRYVKDHTDELFDLSEDEQHFQKYEAFTGAELVHETHRLALMNAMLHDMEGEIYLCDTLSNQGKILKNYDVVLTNPPFGTKKGGERASREDLTYMTSNKQLNFYSISIVLSMQMEKRGQQSFYLITYYLRIMMVRKSARI